MILTHGYQWGVHGITIGGWGWKQGYLFNFPDFFKYTWMTLQENFLPYWHFKLFMMSVWPWFYLDRERYWLWILRTSSIQFHNELVFLPPHKPHYHIMDRYDGNTYFLKKGWIYRQRRMWFRRSMKYFSKRFTWKCGYFRLLLGLPSSVIVWCVRFFLCCCGLVFVPNLGSIGFLYIKSSGLVNYFSVSSAHDDVDDNSQYRYQCISQESML